MRVRDQRGGPARVLGEAAGGGWLAVRGKRRLGWRGGGGHCTPAACCLVRAALLSHWLQPAPPVYHHGTLTHCTVRYRLYRADRQAGPGGDVRRGRQPGAPRVHDHHLIHAGACCATLCLLCTAPVPAVPPVSQPAHLGCLPACLCCSLCALPAPAQAAWKPKPVSLNIPANTKPVRIVLEGTPLLKGMLVLTGCRWGARVNGRS